MITLLVRLAALGRFFDGCIRLSEVGWILYLPSSTR